MIWCEKGGTAADILGAIFSEAGCIGMSCPSDFFTTISQLEREWSKLYLQAVSYQLSAEGTMFLLTKLDPSTVEQLLPLVCTQYSDFILKENARIIRAAT
eukprot:Em0009g14a